MNKAGTSLMTEEQYLESKGFGMTSLGEFGLHRYPRRPSKSQERSTQKLTLQRQNEWQEQRNKLRDEYRQRVQEGEVRPPSRVEKLLQTARGMPDNSAVQAARRILRGMGLWNDEMERESDMNKTAVARELVGIAREISGMDFSTQKQLDDYLKEHPDADRSKHKVVKHDPSKPETHPYNLMQKRKNEEAEQSKRKTVWDSLSPAEKAKWKSKDREDAAESAKKNGAKMAARNVFDVYLYENFSSGHPSLEVNLDIGIAAMQIGELVKRLKDAEDGAVNIIRSIPAKLSGVTMMVHSISLGVRATALCRLQLIPGASLDDVFNSLRGRTDTGKVEIR